MCRPVARHVALLREDEDGEGFVAHDYLGPLSPARSDAALRLGIRPRGGAGVVRGDHPGPTSQSLMRPHRRSNACDDTTSSVRWAPGQRSPAQAGRYWFPWAIQQAAADASTPGDEQVRPW